MKNLSCTLTTNNVVPFYLLPALYFEYSRNYCELNYELIVTLKIFHKAWRWDITFGTFKLSFNTTTTH